MFPGLDVYYTYPALHLTTAGEELGDLDRDVPDLSVGRVTLYCCKDEAVLIPRSVPNTMGAVL